MHPKDYNLIRAAYTVNQLLEVVPLGRTSLYSVIKAGKLKAVKSGKTTLFLASDVADFLASLPTMQDGASHAG
jgi:excisionase family DNA binding protein